MWQCGSHTHTGTREAKATPGPPQLILRGGYWEEGSGGGGVGNKCSYCTTATDLPTSLGTS